MAFFQMISKNGWYKQIYACYGNDFPIQTREILADFLSENDQLLQNCQSENPDHHGFIQDFIQRLKIVLIQSIGNWPSQSQSEVMAKNLLEMQCQHIQTVDPLLLYQTIQNSIRLEKEMIDELDAIRNPQPSTCAGASAQSTPKSFAFFAKEVEAALANVQVHWEQMTNAVDGLETLKTTLESQNEGDINAARQHLHAGMNSANQAIFQAWSSVSGVFYGQILQGLKGFKEDQLHEALGLKSHKKLQLFENWFLAIARCSESVESYIRKFIAFCSSVNFRNFDLSAAQAHIDALKTAMVKSCLVIERIPKQVIRAGAYFPGDPVKLRILPFSTNEIQIFSKDPIFVNVSTANKICQSGYNHAQLPQKAIKLDFEKSQKGNIIEFSKMKAAEDGEIERMMVAEKHFWIYFQVQVQWAGQTKTLWELSLPIWVTSHPSQEPKAWTHVIWHNAFKTEEREGVLVASANHWNKLLETINVLFRGLGRGLSNNQKDYLKNKIFREPVQDEMVTKSMFCSDTFTTLVTLTKKKPKKKQQPDPKISFGEWICYCWGILRWESSSSATSMRDFWAQGKIIGFMDKKDIQEKLANQPSGTFLIRFPENRPDYIGLYFYSSQGNSDNLLRELLTMRDFEKKPLQDFILESDVASLLYSNFPVDGNTISRTLAFKPSGTQDGDGVTEGYFRSVLRSYIPRGIRNMLKRNEPAQPVVPMQPSWSTLASFQPPRNN